MWKLYILLQTVLKWMQNTEAWFTYLETNHKRSVSLIIWKDFFALCIRMVDASVMPLWIKFNRLPPMCLTWQLWVTTNKPSKEKNPHEEFFIHLFICLFILGKEIGVVWRWGYYERDFLIWGKGKVKSFRDFMWDRTIRPCITSMGS